ncbi:heme-binding protein [Rubinisphaera margarita]|uniref:heme-binding protein n=1 Tax=Rubinisphaera margarita TaxID=2909586 RepID=UPI001EE84555|nr:heme-binding protein [Rubinisphaera margarita]MCG6155325.1 heme-binding protein [Rubinisphaera margarita]
MFRKRVLASVSAVVALVFAAGLGRAGDQIPEEVLEAAEVLKQALQDRSLKKSSTMEDWKEVAHRAGEMLPEDHYGVAMLREAVERAQQQSTESEMIERMRRELEWARESLTFVPVVEGELPQGFPEITPVNVIEVKTYPGYRIAKAGMTNGQDGTFMRLFGHIKRNEIAMTVPVEINYESTGPDADQESMAFLYRKPEMGSTGADPADERVEVVDVPAGKFVSIGCRGTAGRSELDFAVKRLEEWLETQGAEYEATGAMRTMAYNSPFVLPFNRYFEVQIPVRQVDNER